MSLLWMEYENEFEHLVEASYERESRENPEYFSRLSDRVKKIIYRDTRYNVDFLYTAYVLGESKVMNAYAVWLYQLMAGILKKRGMNPPQVEIYVIRHLESVKQSIPGVVSQDKVAALQEILAEAQESIREFCRQQTVGQMNFPATDYEEQVQAYMAKLLKRDSRGAVALIRQYLQDGIGLDNIYVDILAESMRRVGILWHNSEITVDMEHYCTAVTQTAMSQFYDELFQQQRQDKMILCVCPGMELHEMGARIIVDVFENHGWDSVFLGAAVPVDYIMNSIGEEQPDLLALSVSMPQHLMDCQKVVEMVHAQYPEVKVAVGGKAFESTEKLWEKWPVDIYAANALELLAKAKEIC